MAVDFGGAAQRTRLKRPGTVDLNLTEKMA